MNQIDIPDMIAGALGVSRGTAYDMMREALAEQPAQQKPVAWGIVASNTGRICQVELDADEVEGHNPKHIVPLYTSPPAQRTWVEVESIRWEGTKLMAKLKEKP